jgi:hypothetical protein
LDHQKPDTAIIPRHKNIISNIYIDSPIDKENAQMDN